MFHLEDKDHFIKPLPHERKKSVGRYIYYRFFNSRHDHPCHPDYFLDNDADYMAYLAQRGKVGSKEKVKSIIEHEFDYTSAELFSFTVTADKTLVLASMIKGKHYLDVLTPSNNQSANVSLQVFPADGPFALIKVPEPRHLRSAEAMLANCTDVQKIYGSPKICQSLLQHVMEYKATRDYHWQSHKII